MSRHSLLTVLSARSPTAPWPATQVVDTPGRDTADPGFLDYGHQRLFRELPRLEKRRKVAALAEFRDPELQRTQARVERAVPVAVAVGRAVQ